MINKYFICEITIARAQIVERSTTHTMRPYIHSYVYTTHPISTLFLTYAYHLAIWLVVWYKTNTAISRLTSS